MPLIASKWGRELSAEGRGAVTTKSTTAKTETKQQSNNANEQNCSTPKWT